MQHVYLHSPTRIHQGQSQVDEISAYSQIIGSVTVLVTWAKERIQSFAVEVGNQVL